MDVRRCQQAVVVLTVPMLCVPRMDLACQIALDATCTVYMEENGRKEIDIKRYAKVEKVGASDNLREAGVVGWFSGIACCYACWHSVDWFQSSQCCTLL